MYIITTVLLKYMVDLFEKLPAIDLQYISSFLI